MKKQRSKKMIPKFELKKALSEWKATFILLLVMCVFRSVIADWNDVPTGSMKPTILEGDRVFVNKLAYDLKVPFTTLKLMKWGNPSRGDIVVFYSPVDGTRFVKRVIGVPGDEITLSDNRLILNGEPQNISKESIFCKEYQTSIVTEENLSGKKHLVMLSPQKEALRNFESVKVPDGSYFVMGDNRDNSFDSRYFGCIKRGSIIGKGSAVIFSLNRAFTKLE